MGDLKSADWTLLLLIAVGSLRIPGSHACNTAGIVYIRDQLMALWYPTHLAGERATIPEELKRRQRGCRAGLKQRIKKRRYTPYIPAVITGNMRSLANKVDKLEALARTQREHREPSIMCFTDTWLHEQILLQRHQRHHSWLTDGSSRQRHHRDRQEERRRPRSAREQQVV